MQLLPSVLILTILNFMVWIVTSPDHLKGVIERREGVRYMLLGKPRFFEASERAAENAEVLCLKLRKRAFFGANTFGVLFIAILSL